MGCLVEWIVDLDLHFHRNLSVKTQVSQLKNKCSIIISMCMKLTLSLSLCSLPFPSSTFNPNFIFFEKLWSLREIFYPSTKWNIDRSVKVYILANNSNGKTRMHLPFALLPAQSMKYAKAVLDNSALDLHSLWLLTCSITNLNGCILEENIPCRSNLTLCIFKCQP